MRISTNTERLRSFSEVFAVTLLTDAITIFGRKSNADSLTDMNGRIQANKINHLDNLIKMPEKKLISDKNAEKYEVVSTANDKTSDKEKINENKERNSPVDGSDSSSDDEEDVSSLTSDSESETEASLEESSEEEEEEEEDLAVDRNSSRNNEEITNNIFNAKDAHENGNETVNVKLGSNKDEQRVLGPSQVDVNHGRSSRQYKLDGTSIGSLGQSSNKALTNSPSSGATSAIASSSSNPPDLIKGNLNNSGSDDSDMKDHSRILAELQKIVNADEVNGESSRSTTAAQNANRDQALDKGPRMIDRTTVDKGKTTATADGVGNGSGKVEEDDGTVKSSNETNTTKLMNNLKKEHSTPKARNVASASRMNEESSKSEHNVNEIEDRNKEVAKNEQVTTGNVQENTNDDFEHNFADKSKEVRKTDTKAEDSESNLSMPTTSTPANFGSRSLENLERKLSNLQMSSSEQTGEIQRLDLLNRNLKAKFEKLEQTSSERQDLEDKMLQRNEELEQHLLGMLKSQEIIFEMKENLKVATADKDKLKKDYKDAVKALEAVDKLFGQKDALVNKWKEATEESKQLVELLKKHNAEVGDLETVDSVKEQIAELKEKLRNCEERNEQIEAKNADSADVSRQWREKYLRENEKAFTRKFELMEATKELKNQKKLAAKRGRKMQTLQQEVTELKDTLKLANEKLVENERRLKELERKNSNTQEMYAKIIHEKEVQHSVLIKTSESYQKDLVSSMENSENTRKEMETLRENISSLEKEKISMAEKLKRNENSLEETLNKKTELSEKLAKLESDFETSQIEAVDNELYTEEQAVRLRELEEQCRKLQDALRQYIHSDGRPRNRRPSTAPSRYHYGGRRLRPSQTWPSQLDVYRELLSPPKGIPQRRSSIKREARYRVHITEKSESQDYLDESNKRITFNPNRPKSTYGNRSLSTNHNEERDQDARKDWVPKIALVDNQTLESSSEQDSSSVSADQYAMQYVKRGDRVLFELAVDGEKQNVPGIVKYIGPVYHSNFKSGIYAGLKLDIGAGDTNGIVGNRKYFRCLKNHGKFVKMSHILAVQNTRTQQYTRVLPMAHSTSK